MIDIQTKPHIPVLGPQVLTALQPKIAGTYVDATFGAGGYSQLLFETLASVNLYAFDRDILAKQYAEKLQSQLTAQQKIYFLHARFANLQSELEQQGIKGIDGIMFDLGLSSMQIADQQRGFSFAKDAPLDMNMGCSTRRASELLNQANAEDLADILYYYGGERRSRAIARQIINYRQQQPIKTTFQFKEIIYKVLGNSRFHKTDSATRSFQALRMWVNDEIMELQTALTQAVGLLQTGARIAVVTFHSGEDRIVKNYFREHAQLQIINKQPIIADITEVQANPRARSAKLRVAQKINEVK